MGARAPQAGASPETVLSVLRKSLPLGRLHRIPRNPEHRDIVMAALCLEMRRRYPYSEVEMNRYLLAVLDGLRAKVDHVTCRRYLVDLGFVRRDRAGARYLLNYPKLESVLSGDALGQMPELIEEAMAANRRRRKTRAEHQETT